MADKQHKGKCPICSEPTDAHYRPFCSKRCADIDLHRWFSGRYAIAASDDDEPDSGARGQRGGTAGELDDDADNTISDDRKSKKD